MSWNHNKNNWERNSFFFCVCDMIISNIWEWLLWVSRNCLQQQSNKRTSHPVNGPRWGKKVAAHTRKEKEKTENYYQNVSILIWGMIVEYEIDSLLCFFGGKSFRKINSRFATGMHEDDIRWCFDLSYDFLFTQNIPTFAWPCLSHDLHPSTHIHPLILLDIWRLIFIHPSEMAGRVAESQKSQKRRKSTTTTKNIVR